MDRLIQIYKGNPAVLNSVGLVVLGIITTALSTPGGVKAAVLAVVAVLAGFLTRSQVTPTIQGVRKWVSPEGWVAEVPVPDLGGRPMQVTPASDQFDYEPDPENEV